MVVRWVALGCIGVALIWARPVVAERVRPAWFDYIPEPIPSYEPLNLRYAPPRGYRRLPVEAGSFGHWLRSLPIRTDRMQVLSYAGRPLVRPSAGLVLMDVGERDLMQCADAVIRLHAEYLWANGRAHEAAYRFTSGDNSRWTDWMKGERFLVAGSRVVRSRGADRGSDHRSFRAWLNLVFTYAGTRSLARDAIRPHASDPIRAGDFYVEAGSPGHAVIVLDVVQNAQGHRLGLIGQGFMPAEDIHVLRSPEAVDGVWFELPIGGNAPLRTPSWRPFLPDSRRRLE